MRGIGAGTRIFELLDRTPAIQPGVGVALGPKRTGLLRFENITFSYPTRSGVNVLEDFNLEVKVGENVAIVYVLSKTSLVSQVTQSGTVGGVEAASHPCIPYC
jgi:ABC-type transport system involved in cytochrome bd biosynthesis fused ATPase/permease subunit